MVCNLALCDLAIYPDPLAGLVLPQGSRLDVPSFAAGQLDWSSLETAILGGSKRTTLADTQHTLLTCYRPLPSGPLDKPGVPHHRFLWRLGGSVSGYGSVLRASMQASWEH